MYIRFETNICFQGTPYKKGIFAAMGDLKRMNKMSEAEKTWYQEVADWFNQNLANPSCFDPPVSDDIKFRAKSWFVLAQTDFLLKAKAVANLLQKHAIVVNELTSDDPGEILYKDSFQVIALSMD